MATSYAAADVRAPVLGLRANAAQFWTLVVLNAFVGAMVGIERDVVPLVGREIFGIASTTAVASFVVTFGLTKALANLYAGRTADRVGRKPLLVVGWVIGLPIPFVLMFAPAWGWIVAANVLLGINQGLCWSMTVVMKIDLVGPTRRGLAMGLNEFAGYFAVGIAAYASGAVAAHAGLRPWPFVLGAVVAFAGLAIAVCVVRETHAHAHHEAGGPAVAAPATPFRRLFAEVSYRDRTLGAVSQAGLINNANDALVWAVIPLFLATSGMPLGRIAIVAAAYPAAWGLLQIATGPLSDTLGRKWPIVAGMLLQAAAIAAFLVPTFPVTIAAALALGAGTALVYPTFLAAIGDVVDPRIRGSAIGVYRLWRDGGYAVGALLAGVVADRVGAPSAILMVAALTALSGLFVAVRMHETLPRTTS